MLPQQCLVILLLLINVIMFQNIDLIEMRSIQTDHHPSPQSSTLAQTNEINNEMNMITLTQTLETIQTLLSSHKNKILSSGKNKIPIKERNRLIRMVHKVVQLANQVLDLNYTDLSQTTNQSGNEFSPSGLTIHHDDIKNNNITKTKRNSENPVVGQLIPVDLFKPCEQSDIVTIHSMNEQDDNPTTETDVSLEDYELPEFEYESRSIIRRSTLTGKFKMGFDLLQEMIFKVNSLKGLVTDMIRKNLMKNCLILKVPPIFKIPNSSSQQNISYTLATIYQSLANQTAHLYFIWAEQKNKQQQQEQQHSDRLSEGGCTKHKRFELIVPDNMDQQNRSKLYTTEGLQWFIPGIENNDEKNQLNLIIDDFFVVSNNLRSLLCNLGQAIQLFNIPVPMVEITQQVLRHRIRVNRGSCARRSIFECQLMRDAVRFFADFEDFLRKESHRFLSIPTAAATTTTTIITNTNKNSANNHRYLFDRKQHLQHAR